MIYVSFVDIRVYILYSITLKTMLFSLYIFNVFAMGYVVFALERAYGTCMEYIDVVWLVAVTLTNLGYGEFTPRFGPRFTVRPVASVDVSLARFLTRTVFFLMKTLGPRKVSGYQEQLFRVFRLLA